MVKTNKTAINKVFVPDQSNDEDVNCFPTKTIERIIGYEYNDPDILEMAFTHAGYKVKYGEKSKSYQRMEYLGDAILDFIVADELYRNNPTFDEGKMTKIRSNLVSKTPLAKIIEGSGLAEYILYDKDSITLSDKMKCDIFESIIASIYLDSNNFKASRMFAMKYIKPLIAKELDKDVSDYKSILYEYCTQQGLQIEFRQVKTEGPPHNLTFFFELYVDNVLIAQAEGSPKRKVHQDCSKLAIIKLGVKD